MVISFCDTSILCRNNQTHKEFRNSIKTWLVNNYLNTSFANIETGFEIFINKTFIEKATTKFGDVKAHAFTIIPDIIKNATLIKSEDDKRGRADILEVLKFESLIEVNGEHFVVWLYVRKTKSQFQLYSLNIKV